MEISKQNQAAGDNSTQFQNCPIIINNSVGISEERVRAIFLELFELAKKDFTHEALEIAQKRVEEFENAFIPKIMESEERLNALKDPSFQFMLMDANKKAACMKRNADYNLLTELLIHRTDDLQNRDRNAGINVAISIIDQIDDVALRGLTLGYLMIRYIPNTYKIDEGMSVLDELYGTIINDGLLPDGTNWLENLDLLKCMRVSSFTSQVNFIQLLKNKCNGYFCQGIRKDSKEYEQALKLIADYGLPTDILIEHELFFECYRLPIVNKASIEKLGVIKQQSDENGVVTNKREEFSTNQIEAINKIFELLHMNQDDKLLENKIKEVIQKYSYLTKACDWWDAIQFGFNISLAGKVLAHANASRLNNSLPAFED